MLVKARVLKRIHHRRTWGKKSVWFTVLGDPLPVMGKLKSYFIRKK